MKGPGPKGTYRSEGYAAHDRFPPHFVGKPPVRRWQPRHLSDGRTTSDTQGLNIQGGCETMKPLGGNWPLEMGTVFK